MLVTLNILIQLFLQCAFFTKLNSRSQLKAKEHTSALFYVVLSSTLPHWQAIHQYFCTSIYENIKVHILPNMLKSPIRNVCKTPELSFFKLYNLFSAMEHINVRRNPDGTEKQEPGLFTHAQTHVYRMSAVSVLPNQMYWEIKGSTTRSHAPRSFQSNRGRGAR